MPWRNTSDPYKIWLSEIILQQTQVAQGLSYYLKFVKNYPTVKHLAKAAEDKVMKDWQGLGYYSRARNLQTAAKQIVEDYNGVFPSQYKDIKSLKGVGDYTAAAIASFAFNLPHAVVDGNVYRVLSRIFGIETAIDTTEGKKQFALLAQQLLDTKDPHTHNQAVMEFGSQYCKPVNPGCHNCIFKSRCFALKNNMVNVLPKKAHKTKVTNRYFNYLVIFDKNDKLIINKRGGKDIWQGLYDFPLIESDKPFSQDQVFSHPDFKKLIPSQFTVLSVSKSYKHVLSHRQLHAVFYIIKVKKSHTELNLCTNVKGLTKFAFPRLIEKFLNDCILT